MNRLCKVTLTLLIAYLASCASVELSTTILQVSDGAITNISLSKYNKRNADDQAFTQLLTVNGSTNFEIKVTDIPEAVSFVIIQVHTYIYNVSISSDEKPNNKSPGKFVTGSNIGLSVDTNSASTASVYVSNENSFEISSLIAVVAYTNVAPYPGGCNMEFEVENSPFLKLSYDDSTVKVDAQPAAVPKIGTLQPKCELFPLQHDAYRVYMPEQDFDNETYFSAIASMLTVRDVRKNADIIPASLFGSAMRRVYSLYPGTGSVYSMVAIFANHSSAYVPIVTYGCDISAWSTSCSPLTTIFSKVMLSLAFFLGFFLTMRGQYYFTTSMCFIGMLVGSYVGYTIGVSLEFDITGNSITSVVVGVLTSSLWLMFWLTLSSQIPSVVLSGLTFGSLLFFIFYYTKPADLVYIEVDAYYWLVFTCVIVIIILIFSVVPLAGNILCFTGFGAYITILALDYLTQSNLKYIVINSIRRITNSNFNVAVIQPPFQYQDMVLTVFWGFLVILGLFKQCATNWDRAPFPPLIRNFTRDSERTPLLY